MEKKYTRKQLIEAINYYKKLLSETYEKPYLYDAQDNGKIVTVGQLKKILANFKDNDVIDICDVDGVPGHVIKALWNANMEYEMTGDDDGRDDVCYMRIAEY